MKVGYFFFMLAAWLVAAPAAAQSSPASPTTATTPSQRQAAEALLNTIYTEASFNQLIDNALQVQLKQHPELQRFEGDMRDFMRKYLSLSSLKPDLVAAYAHEFSEAELLEITRFYQSPTGQKMAAKLPAMMTMGMELGQRRMQEHLPELQKIFSDKVSSHESHIQK
jgi:hypothetical protein